MKLQTLTPKQEQVFRFMATHFAKNARMPTLREISGHMGIASRASGPLCHLKALEQKGYIRRGEKGKKGMDRGMEIVGLAELLAPVVERHVEAMLGTRAAHRRSA
jgi:SOS-response transcriptional repressor LexA